MCGLEKLGDFELTQWTVLKQAAIARNAGST